MALSDVIGNDMIVRRLKILKAADIVSHAYVFEGPDGIGKRFTAFNFAKTLFCRENDDDACEECLSCKKLNHENHQDFYYITPEGNSIKDMQIEMLQENIQKKPFSSDRTIFVIDKADSMTTRAQNRLLKTLEEPPGNITIILLAENSGNIVPTILSRCIIFKFKPIPRELVKRYIIEKHGLGEDEADVVASFSYGTIGKAEKLCTSETFKARRELCNRIAQAILKKDKVFSNLKELSEISSSKEDALEMLDLLECWFRDLMIVEAGDCDQLILNLDYKPLLSEAARQYNEVNAGHVIEIIEEAKNDINMNININYSIKNMLIKAQEESNGKGNRREI